MNEEERIEAELERLGLEPSDRGRYWYIRCPFHEDSHKSAQCFKDGWIHCHAGCPRRHINSLSGFEVCSSVREHQGSHQEKDFSDFTDLWLSLQPVAEPVKGIPVSVLRRLGWKEYDGRAGDPPGVFIPYFNTKRDRVPFYQIRHGEESFRRFSFPVGARQMCYGMECLPEMEKYLVFTEGSRDSVILRMCGIPAVALPSASSGNMLVRMEHYAKEHQLVLVSVSDRDEAGERLLKNIKGFFIDARTPYGKDVGDLYEKYGKEGVMKYYDKYRSNKAKPIDYEESSEPSQELVAAEDTPGSEGSNL